MSSVAQPQSHHNRFADLWGGIASMLVALPSSLAFGVVIYSPLGPEYAGIGALAGILGAITLGITAPLVGRTGGLISAPCAPSAAVLSALVAGLTAGSIGHTMQPQAIVPLLALTVAVAALLQILFGVLGGGRFIKYIPYPVVIGYLTGVALIIAIGQMPKFLGLPRGTTLVDGIIAPSLWKWEGVIIGVVTMSLTVLGPRITKRLPASILGLAGGLAAYGILALVLPHLRTTENNALLIGAIPGSGAVGEVIQHHLAGLGTIELSQFSLILIPAVTLAVLLSIDTLKTCLVLDAITRKQHDSNKELIGQGCGNLLTFIAGGIPGAGTAGASLVNVASGGRTPRAGVIEGASVLLVYFFFAGAIAWVPVAALAGILLITAWRMVDRSIVRLAGSPSGRVDLLVILTVILVSVLVDLIAASLVGVALSIFLFLRDQIKGSVIRRKLYLDQISSKTRRHGFQLAVLERKGNLGVFCELQGNLFFGTTDQLRSQLHPDLATKLFIICDMRRVDSMDYTAAHILDQMHTQLTERGGGLLFCGMPAGGSDPRNFEMYFRELGMFGGDHGMKVFATSDEALEWTEEQILASENAQDAHTRPPLELKDFELFAGSDERTLDRLRTFTEPRSFREDQVICTIGEKGDELFLVRKGSIRIILPLENGKRHHLATIGRGDFFGELTFLDGGHRTAQVEAKRDTELFVLSRPRFDELVKEDPALGSRVYAQLALGIGKRLRHTDAELSVLLER